LKDGGRFLMHIRVVVEADGDGSVVMAALIIKLILMTAGSSLRSGAVVEVGE
jgi:hypothetical protein